MNKKLFPVILLITLLSACDVGVTSFEFHPYENLEKAQETFIEEKGDIYYRNNEVKPYVIEEIEGINIKTGIHSYSSLDDVSRGFDENSYSSISYNKDNLNGIVEQNLLVVPVYFTDSSVANSPSLKEKKKTIIENAFFGEEKYNFYQSVTSYYNQSSYGHLRIKGEVLDWVNINQSSSEALSQGKNSPENYTDKIVKQIVDNLSSDIFNKYSSNRSGVLDALYIIYDYPYQSDKTNDEEALFWAFTYHCKSTAKVSNYSWSSFDFVGDKALKNNKPDASTYIHETGHLFGLLDYYNKGKLSYYQPLGFMDMMDYNLGDHSPLSKFLLNWTSPYILDMGEHDSGDISIEPFTSSGKFILVPRSDYNGTAYDRYLLISYFAPRGLNDLSNFPSYEYTDINGVKGVFTYPKNYGVMVYEVDARLGYYWSDTIRSFIPTCYADEVPNRSGNYVINFYNDNEINSSDEHPLYHLLESSGSNTFMNGKCANNNTLFRLNSTFGVNTFNDLAEEFGISFKVSKVTTKEATISFQKIEKSE